MKVFRKEVLRKIFLSNTEEVKECWKYLVNNDLRDTCS